MILHAYDKHIYRVESFIEHQDACTMGRLRSESQALQPAACLSRTASSPSPSSTDTNLAMPPINTSTSNNPSDTTTTPTTALVILTSTASPPQNPILSKNSTSTNPRFHNLDLQLSTTTTTTTTTISNENHASPLTDNHHENHYSTQLQLSIGSSSDFGEKNESNNHKNSPRESMMSSTTTANCNLDKTRVMKEEAREQLRVAMAEKSYAEEARQQAKRQIELAEQEFANAKRLRQQAQAELDKAQALKEHAIKQLNSTLLQLTCHACKHHFHARTLSYIITTSDCQTLENDRTVLPIRDRLGKSTINPS